MNKPTKKQQASDMIERAVKEYGCVWHGLVTGNCAAARKIVQFCQKRGHKTVLHEVAPGGDK